MTKKSPAFGIMVIFLTLILGCNSQNNTAKVAEENDTTVQQGENDLQTKVVDSLEYKSPFKQQSPDESSNLRNTAEFHYKRGLVLFQINKYEEGLKEFDTVIRMEPTLGSAYTNRGNAWMQLKKYDEAIKDLKKAISLNDSDSIAYLNLGLSYLYNGDFENSIEASTRLLKLTPRDEKVYFNRGFSYGQIKDYKNAISDFDKAIQINPTYHEAFFNRGLAYFFSGDKISACSDWQTAKSYGSEKAATALEKECQ